MNSKDNKKNPKISVIIPVKNDEIKIVNCLDALCQQSLKPHEIIVVDGHSTDNTIINIERFPVKIFLENYGTVAGARQIGLLNATGDFVAFTDSDCIPLNNWLEELYVEFKDGIIGVGGGTLCSDKQFWRSSIYLSLNTFFGSAKSIQDRFYKTEKIVKSISGSNSMYRRSDLLNVGGFNINIDKKIGSSEDTDLNRKLIKIGKLLYTPKALVAHDHNENLSKFAKRMYFWGFLRAKDKFWDTQAIPPFLVLFILIVSVFYNNLFIYSMALYLSIILIYGILIFVREAKIEYAISVPIVFVVEHFFYIIGFWRGLVKATLNK